MSIQEDWADPSAPQKRPGMGTGMKILLVIGALFGVACLACCGAGGWLFYSLSNSLKTKPEEILAVQESIVSIKPPPNVKPAMAMDVLGTFKMVIYNKSGKPDDEDVVDVGQDEPARDVKPPVEDKPADEKPAGDAKPEGDAVAAAEETDGKTPDAEKSTDKAADPAAPADNVAEGENNVAEGAKDAAEGEPADEDAAADQVAKTGGGPRVFMLIELPKSFGGQDLNEEDFMNGMRNGGRGEGGLPSVNVLKTEFKEYEIRGKKVKVSLQTGTERNSGVTSKQVKCVIPSKSGSAILIYIASKDDWDDKAVDEMLKTIK